MKNPQADAADSLLRGLGGSKADSMPMDTGRDSAELPEEEEEEHSVLKQVMSDIQDALSSLKDGNTKKAGAILSGILKQNEDMGRGKDESHPDMEMETSARENRY